MSKVFMSKKKKSTSSRLKTVSNKPTVSKKNQLNVKITRPKVLGMINSLAEEERDEKLEIFHKKVMKKTTLPSISNLLSSSSKDSEESSQLINLIERPQRPGTKKYAQNRDVFIKKDLNSNLIDNEQFDKPTSSPLDNSRTKLHDYSMSRMFSDGLSDQENFGQEFSNFYELDDFETDSLPPAMGYNDTKKTEDILAGENECRKESGVLKNLGRNGSGLFPEGCSSRANFERNKELGQSCDYDGPDDSLERNKELNIFSQKTMKNLLGLASLLNNSPDVSPQPKTKRFCQNAEPFVFGGDVNPESSTVYGNYTENEDPSFSKNFAPRNSMREIMYDDDCEGCAAATINIALSECNLDLSVNSEDCIGRSIQSIDKRAAWYMNEDNLIENGVDLTPERNSILWEKTRMNYEKDENLDLSDSIFKGVNFMEKNSIIETEEGNNTSQNGLESSDPFVQIFGSPISGRSRISLPPYVSAFNFLPNRGISLKSNNEIRSESRQSSFDTTQQMYIQERSPFLNRKKTKHATTATFKLCDSVTKELERSGPKNYDNMRKFEDNDSYPGKGMETYNDFIEKLNESNTKKFAAFNSTKKCSERRYPFDENISFLNVETNDANGLCQADKNTARHVREVKNAQSEHQLIPMDQLSCTSFGTSIFSNDNVTDRSSLTRFWKVSRHVQSFVKEWLNKNDEINSEVPEMFMDKEKLSLKRRRLDVDSEKEDETIHIDHKMMLSNFSCEYDRADMIERFKPE